LPEASVLCGFDVTDMDGMKAAAKKIHQLGPRLLLVKGGHLTGRAVDLLYDGDRFYEFDAPRLKNQNTHGTGCTFSAALATLLAKGLSPVDAVQEAKTFISQAIALGIPIGSGHGPTNHYAPVLRLKEREKVRTVMEKAIDRLYQSEVGYLIPEVRSNLGYALPAALDYMDVMAVPGRISQIGSTLLIARQPAYGASRHIARVILAAMQKDGDVRSAMNIRYSPEIVAACRNLKMQMAYFDRSEEPKAVKEREGSSLEWGTTRALEGVLEMPDCICDEGEKGKEPMIRVLGKDPLEVVEKVIRLSGVL
jgi:hydroxymethylpyrimidine/phosphomethylpyrimidine kinase